MELISIVEALLFATQEPLGVPQMCAAVKETAKDIVDAATENAQLPGESVQIDVKVVTRQHSKWFQYTAIDDCTRIRVLRLYRHLNQRSSLAFLREVVGRTEAVGQHCVYQMETALLGASESLRSTVDAVLRELD